MPKTSSIAILVWRLAARGEPLGDRDLKQRQWSLYACDACRQGWSRQTIGV